LKISPPPGFDPWIVQPVASHYTDYAIPAHLQPNFRYRIRNSPPEAQCHIMCHTKHGEERSILLPTSRLQECLHSDIRDYSCRVIPIQSIFSIHYFGTRHVILSAECKTSEVPTAVSLLSLSPILSHRRRSFIHIILPKNLHVTSFM